MNHQRCRDKRLLEGIGRGRHTLDNDSPIPMGDQTMKILLVEDDEDDYVILRKMLSQIPGQTYNLEWASGFDDALLKTSRTDYDLFLVDYRLGIQNGLELLRVLQGRGYPAPVILLTGKGDYEIDLQAMKSGASEYLEKGDLTPTLLERSIRYTVEHSSNLQALRESERQLRALSEKLLNAQENERKIVSREIHDGLGSTLTAIRYALEQRLSTADPDLRSAAIPLEQIIEMVREAIGESQRISSSLRPSVLDDLGLIPALSSLTREWGRIYGDIRIDKQLEVSEDDIPEPLKIVIFRIVQESLNNISKHSRAGKVLLRLTKTVGRIELIIADDGLGFDLEEVALPKVCLSGMGLAGMRERADLSSGNFEIHSEKGKGTVVRAHWLA